MSSARQETVSDIVAEMRGAYYKMGRSNASLDKDMMGYMSFMANRIEAAHNRELESTVEKSSVVGNAEAMREALDKILWCLEWMSNNAENKIIKDHLAKPIELAKSALSAPPRNCDRFATLDDARNAFFADYVSDETCSSATAFAIWLFDEAKGATDGSK